MPKRKLLGIPLEKHRIYAPALMHLDLLAPGLKRAGKLAYLCEELRSELDAHVFFEFTELPEQRRFDVYYTAPPDFDPDKGSLGDLLPTLVDLAQALAAAAPDTRVCRLAQGLLQEAEKLAAR